MSEHPVDRPDVTAYMAEASRALGRTLSAPKDVFSFGDEHDRASTDERLRHALAGLKTATTSWPVPNPRHWDVGDLSVILDSAGKPSAVMRTLELVECKFRDVAEDFALAENEGTYEDYRVGHIRFYNRQGKGEFGDESMVLCERFEVIYPVRQS